MEKIVIDGGNALHGRIEVSGMKNALHQKRNHMLLMSASLKIFQI